MLINGLLAIRRDRKWSWNLRPIDKKKSFAKKKKKFKKSVLQKLQFVSYFASLCLPLSSKPLKGYFKSFCEWVSVNHQMAVPVPSISFCVFNNNDFFYQEPNELAFNRDTSCHLVICLRLIASHFVTLAASLTYFS